MLSIFTSNAGRLTIASSVRTLSMALSVMSRGQSVNSLPIALRNCARPGTRLLVGTAIFSTAPTCVASADLLDCQVNDGLECSTTALREKTLTAIS
jgi:hypothetical protein